MERIQIPKKSLRQIRKEIYFKGSKNSLNYWDDYLSQNWEGITRSHISFVRQKHRNVSKYREAVLDIDAASVTLSLLKDYYLNGNDFLFHEFYNQYKLVVSTGAQQAIDCCKEILQFVKYPEGRFLPYENYNWHKLKEMAKYKTIIEYPRSYIMYYDVINEFDLKLDRNKKREAAYEYASEFLEPYPYKEGKPISVNQFDSAMTIMCSKLRKRTINKIRDIILKGSPNRLSKVNNSYCGLGSKKCEFFQQTYEGFQNIDNPMNHDLDTISKLYHISLDKPSSSKEWDNRYYTQLIVQEDPKKPRIAYQSNPLKDYIGYPGMDVLHTIFSDLPFIQCGRKRDLSIDILLDKHRFAEIKKVYQHNRAKHRQTVSSDLSKCTDNLNMITGIEMIKHFLHLLLPDLNQWDIDEFCDNTYSQLYLSPIVVKGYEKAGLFYPKYGQTQGVPGSFHMMTFEMSVANLQACIDAGLEPEDAILSIQNNGDDATGPVVSEPFYKAYICALASDDSYNQEKSFRSDINNSLEFCKTIYYEDNQELITGYRFSTLYKMTRDIKQLAHTLSRGFEHEKDIFTWFTEEVASVLDMELYPNEYNDFYLSYQFYHDISYQNYLLKVMTYRNMKAIEHMAEAIIYRNDDMLDLLVPKSWWYLIPLNTEFKISEGDILLETNLKVLQKYYEIVDQTIDWREIMLNPKHNQALLSTIMGRMWQVNVSSLELQEAHIDNFNQELITIMPTTDVIRQSLGLQEDSVIVLKPRLDIQESSYYSIENYAESRIASQIVDVKELEVTELLSSIQEGKISCSSIIGNIAIKLNK